MDELLALLNDAAANQNWPVLAAGVVLLAVPIVLKAIGKPVPILDQAIPTAIKFLKGIKKPAPKPETLPENQPGLSNVVNIEDARKPEDKGPQA
jgi:hypothetical protein